MLTNKNMVMSDYTQEGTILLVVDVRMHVSNYGFTPQKIVSYYGESERGRADGRRRRWWDISMQQLQPIYTKDRDKGKD